MGGGSVQGYRPKLHGKVCWAPLRPERTGRKRVSEWVGERLSLVYREPQETEGEGDKGGEGKEKYRGRVGESLDFNVQK